jgi:glycosyltransferase involved in cell wall biosynthesis
MIGALDQMDGVDPTYVLVKPEDYRLYPPPWWARATDPWQGQFIARQKARPFLDKEFDVLLINSWEFVTAFGSVARRIPATAFMDAVPATIDAQLRRRGYGGWKRSVANLLHHRPFGRAARAFRYFLPAGSDCASALELQYGIEPARCFLTPPPQDLEIWQPSDRTPSFPTRLLFVGNDFLRKGGAFLLRLFAEHLAETCVLTIASNDPVLSSLPLASGVTVVRGRSRDQLLDLYRDSDLFLFPTEGDFMPHVLAEALAAGLPCIANDVGGIRDLVRTGETGILMPCGTPAAVWAEKVICLSSNPGELTRLASGARSFAEQHLGLPRFEALIAQVLTGAKG